MLFLIVIVLSPAFWIQNKGLTANSKIATTARYTIFQRCWKRYFSSKPYSFSKNLSKSVFDTFHNEQDKIQQKKWQNLLSILQWILQPYLCTSSIKCFFFMADIWHWTISNLMYALIVNLQDVLWIKRVEGNRRHFRYTNLKLKVT